MPFRIIYFQILFCFTLILSTTVLLQCTPTTTDDSDAGEGDASVHSFPPEDGGSPDVDNFDCTQTTLPLGDLVLDSSLEIVSTTLIEHITDTSFYTPLGLANNFHNNNLLELIAFMPDGTTLFVSPLGNSATAQSQWRWWHNSDTENIFPSFYVEDHLGNSWWGITTADETVHTISMFDADIQSEPNEKNILSIESPFNFSIAPYQHKNSTGVLLSHSTTEGNLVISFIQNDFAMSKQPFLQQWILPSTSFSGYLATNSSLGIVFAGSFEDGQNVIRKTSSAWIPQAQPTSLSSLEEIYRGVSSGITANHSGLYIVADGYNQAFQPVYDGLLFISISNEGTPAPIKTVVQHAHQCTSIIKILEPPAQLAQSSQNIYLVVSDHHGLRLLELREAI